jgi:predicted DNA-binding transcriptional regulator AlpA
VADSLSLSLPSAADVASMPAEQLPALLAGLAALQGAVAARLVTVPAPERSGERAEPDLGRNGDRLLTVPQLAERLGRDKRWVYRRAHSPDWNFTVQDGKSLMFSERGLERWIERHRVLNGD